MLIDKLVLMDCFVEAWEYFRPTKNLRSAGLQVFNPKGCLFQIDSKLKHRLMKSKFIYTNRKRDILRQSYLWRQFELSIELVGFLISGRGIKPMTSG